MTRKPDRTTSSLTIDRMATPIGETTIVTDAEGHLRVLEWTDRPERLARALKRFCGAITPQPGAAPALVRQALDHYFAGDLGALRTIPWHIAGTPFQRTVWTALTQISPGTTVRYGELAGTLGRPNSPRAVGAANGANPISVVVPCHRLIGADGTLTGYGGGVARKHWLLRHEGVALPEMQP
jgi:methylated-DNA-[protein]-cysteine S-methyltransferase